MQLIVFAFAFFCGALDLFGQETFEVRHFAGSPGGLGRVDGVGPAARFRYPSGIWGDGTYLYVSDQEGIAIRRITIRTGEVRLIAGSFTESGNQDGIGAAARFRGAGGLWGDGTFLYIADGGNGRIRRMTLATGEVVTIAGRNSGQPADGPASEAVFFQPLDVWGSGKFLYVGDNGQFSSGGARFPARLRRIDLVAETVTTVELLVAGTPCCLVPNHLWGDGRELFIASDALIVAMDLATNSVRVVTDQLSTPDLLRSAGGIWSPGDGYLYFSAYSTSEILKINLSTGQIQLIFGASHYYDWVDGLGPQARLRNPMGIWGDGNRLYIVDSRNHAIRVADLRTSVLTTLAGTGIRRADPNDVPSSPAGVSWSDGTYLYFSARYRIWKMPIAGGSSTVVAGSGRVGTSDGPPGVAQFSNPAAIWGDRFYLYVLDGQVVIRKVALTTGEVTTLAGAPGVHANVDGIGPDARFFSLRDLWGDDTYLYVTDRFTIRRITLATGEVQTIAGNPDTGGSDDGIGPIARFGDPRGIWGDGTYLYISDSVYVADSLIGVIRRMSLATYEVTTLATAMYRPVDVWGDGANLYIADSDTIPAIRRLSLATNEVTTLAGSRTRGRDDGIGSQASFALPYRIWGVGDTLFVDDDQFVRTVHIPTGTVVTIGLKTVEADGIGMSARFGAPQGIWGDGASLYVTDRSVLRRIDLGTREVRTVAGADAGGTSDGVGNTARFWFPRGICAAGGVLYMADTANATIRKIILETWEVSTFAGTPHVRGRQDGIGTAAQFNVPSGLWCDANDIYVADVASHTIRKIKIATREVTTLVDLRPQISRFSSPSQVWSDGRFLYFSAIFARPRDTGLPLPEPTIQKLDLTTLEVATLATFPSDPPDAPFGFLASNFWGDGRYLYIAIRQSIRRVDLFTGEAVIIAGSDIFSGSEDGVGEAARFQNPSAVWGDGSTLYVAGNCFCRLCAWSKTLAVATMKSRIWTSFLNAFSSMVIFLFTLTLRYCLLT